MKIGILTLPLTNNYGGILQAYALQVYLQKLGYEVSLIDRRYNKPSFKSRLKMSIYNIVFARYTTVKRKSEKPFIYFIDKYLKNKTSPIENDNDLTKEIKTNNYDAIIVGSDQVWRIEYGLNIYKNLFLSFSENLKIKRIAYAASFGVDKWKHTNLTNEVSEYLKKFDAISVREDSGVEICEKIFGNKANHNLDPTALLSIQDYLSIMENENEKKWEGELLCYILDDNFEKEKSINFIEEVTSLKKYKLGGTSVNIDNYKNLKGYRKTTITKWLRGFYDAKYVVTDSFHGTMFSIIFNKPFIVIGNKERGLARFLSILKIFNLEERLVLSSNEITKELINKTIDFNKVNLVLEQEKNRSLLFFKNVLS